MSDKMRTSFILRFLYGTPPGRAVLKILVQPWVSKAGGVFFSGKASRWIVPYYIRRHRIRMDDIQIPDGGFSSFNDFFTRKRKTQPPAADAQTLLSPCEGYVSCVRLQRDTALPVKQTSFSLGELLKDRRLAARFWDGTALVFRLTPANYHRYCYAASGRVLCHRSIPGKLHCVRPVALAAAPVFVQNAREYEVIRTKEFGTIVQMEVGALMVGRIQNHPRFDADDRSKTPQKKLLAAEEKSRAGVRAGREKGYFEFGGSTIILLLQKDAVRLPEALQKTGAGGGEIPVDVGEPVAWKEKRT